MRRFFFSVIVLSVGYYSAVAQSAGYQSLEPYDFHLQYLRDDSAMLVDVREHFEFRRNRIHGAVNIPASGNLDFATDTIDRNIVLFLYCSTDYRSRRAGEFFSEKGFTKVFSLEGGIVRWKKEGFPVEKRLKKNGR
jgi:rhodanese-related sulfurtransferase